MCWIDDDVYGWVLVECDARKTYAVEKLTFMRQKTPWSSEHSGGRKKRVAGSTEMKRTRNTSSPTSAGVARPWDFLLLPERKRFDPNEPAMTSLQETRERADQDSSGEDGHNPRCLRREKHGFFSETVVLMRWQSLTQLGGSELGAFWLRGSVGGSGPGKAVEYEI
jgi:hypothetical protein